MQISKVRIRNFRSVKSLEMDLGPTTVLIGPNNTGKTAILDAVRNVLTRRWGQRGTGFTENDIKAFDGRPSRGLVEVVSGGFPCQDIRAARSGDGLDGERSGLRREIQSATELSCRGSSACSRSHLLREERRLRPLESPGHRPKYPHRRRLPGLRWSGDAELIQAGHEL